MKYYAIVLTILFCLATPLSAQEVPRSEPLTIGTSYFVSTHDIERRVHVVLPDGYEDSDQSYPIVIILDAGLKQDFFLTLGLERWNQLWQRSSPAIFVGVETVDRQRELLSPTLSKEEQERYPTAGESQAFRNWLSSEIIPLVRSQYRDDGRMFLVGESAAGHFVTETWVKAPRCSMDMQLSLPVCNGTSKNCRVPLRNRTKKIGRRSSYLLLTRAAIRKKELSGLSRT